MEHEIISSVLGDSRVAELKVLNKLGELKHQQISRTRRNSFQGITADLRKEMSVPTAITMENSLSTSLEGWKIGK